MRLRLHGNWVPAFAGMTWVVWSLTAAHADCLRPPAPEIPSASESDGAFKRAGVQVADYLGALDAYAGCLKAAEMGMKPLNALAAHQDYDSAFAAMQQAVDSYNAALAAHGGIGS